MNKPHERDEKIDGRSDRSSSLVFFFFVCVRERRCACVRVRAPLSFWCLSLAMRRQQQQQKKKRLLLLSILRWSCVLFVHANPRRVCSDRECSGQPNLEPNHVRCGEGVPEIGTFVPVFASVL